MMQKFLELKNGTRLAYNQVKNVTKLPGIIFLGGFRSDMTGAKAIALEAFAKKHKLNFIRFDYRGHGKSSGRFNDLTISTWVEDAAAILDNLTRGPQILVGSSMGGWVGLLLALKRKTRVKAFMGIAAAPDFTEYLIWDKFTKIQKNIITKKGIISIPSDYCDEYPITMKLIEDGRKNLLLHQPIKLDIPVRLIHGMRDEDVPYETALKIADQLTSKDIEVIFKKNSTHRMSKPDDLMLITKTLEQLIN